MSLLDHPDAQALLDDATLTPESVRGCRDRLTRFLQRYLPRFYRQEQRDHAAVVVRGLLSGLEHKTAEPIGYHAGMDRKNIQYFVGCGQWDDEAVQAELRRHVREELSDPDAVLILDPSAFPVRRGPRAAAWHASGAGDWARSTTAKSASSWPTPPRGPPSWSTVSSTYPRSGPTTRHNARRPTCPNLPRLPGEGVDLPGPAQAKRAGPAASLDRRRR